MNFRTLAVIGLMAVGTIFINGQAHAMNLLVAVGNPQIQLIISENGTLQVIQLAEDQIIQVSNLEPAAGTQNTSLQK